MRENPQLIFALMREVGIDGLGLEWSLSAAGSVAAWRVGGPLPNDDDVWWGDGRVTAGHYALLRARPGAAEPPLILFDVAVLPAGATWSDRDAAMAATVLEAPATDGGWLVAAGNAHTLLTATDLGEPLGLHVAKARPGVRSIEVRYQSGSFYNNGPRRFALSDAGLSRFPSITPRSPAKLRLDHGRLVLDVAEAHEADVPHRAAPIC